MRPISYDRHGWLGPARIRSSPPTADNMGHLCAAPLLTRIQYQKELKRVHAARKEEATATRKRKAYALSALTAGGAFGALGPEPVRVPASVLNARGTVPHASHELVRSAWTAEEVALLFCNRCALFVSASVKEPFGAVCKGSPTNPCRLKLLRWGVTPTTGARPPAEALVRRQKVR